MTVNSFGVALCTVSVVVRKVCDIIATVLGPQYIKLPSTPHEMTELVHGMENRYGFPQGFGCVDGTHIHTVPLRNKRPSHTQLIRVYTHTHTCILIYAYAYTRIRIRTYAVLCYSLQKFSLFSIVEKNKRNSSARKT